MAYYAPPGGSLTASVAQVLQNNSLMGLGNVLPTVNVRTPRAVSAAIGAARRARLRVLRAENGASVMTGMGIIAPSHTNVSGHVRFIRPVPPPVTFVHMVPRGLMGLGRGGAARPVGARIVRVAGGGPRAVGPGGTPGFLSPGRGSQDVLTAAGQTQSVHRQSAIFMTPGGGYSQIPGYMPAFANVPGFRPAVGGPPRRLSFMGLGQDTPPDVGPGTVPVGPSPVDIGQPAPPTPPSFFTIPPPAAPSVPAAMIPPSVPNVVTALPSALDTFAAAQPRAIGPRKPFLQDTTFGVSNTVILGGAAVILAAVGMGSRRGRR